MSDTLVPWDRITDGINARLPMWAKYEGSGHALRGVALFVFAAIFGVLAIAAYLVGATLPAIGIGIVAVVCTSFGDYYRQAAKKRVRCSHCGALARGENECPECGGPTFVPGDTE